jgi:hypothetical protein
MRLHDDLAANRFGSAPLPAPLRAALPPEARALAALIEALTAPAPEARPTAAEALRVLEESRC